MQIQIDKKQIIEFCKCYKEYRKFVDETNFLSGIFQGIGFLIEKDLIEKWKKSIFYDELKDSLSSDFSKLEIKIKAPINKIDIFHIKFDNMQLLKNAIFNNKEFILITQSLWEKICSSEYKNEKGINYSIKDNKICLIFNEKEQLELRINNFIINKSSLFENEKFLTNEGKEKKHENYNINIINKEENKNCINNFENNNNAIIHPEKFNNESNPFLNLNINDCEKTNLVLQKAFSSPNEGLKIQNVHQNKKINYENKNENFNLELNKNKSDNFLNSNFGRNINSNGMSTQDMESLVNDSLATNLLNECTKKEILALINYSKFKRDMKKKIINSKDGHFEEMNIYLVNENWINKIKNFYCYDSIIEKIDIKKEITIQNLEQTLKELNLLEIFIERQKIKEKELNILKSESIRPNFSKKIISDRERKFPIDFDLIDKNVFDNLVQKDDNQEAVNCTCIVNSEKVIIQYIEEKKNQFFLIIVNLDIKTNKFCNELLLDYHVEDKNGLSCLKYHFSLLKTKNYKDFVNIAFSEDKKTIYSQNTQPKKLIFGSIIELNSNNNKIEEQQKKLEVIPINKEKLNHILFLLNIHFLQERLIYKINDSLKDHSFKEKYYLIKNDIINKFKDVYKYNELMNQLYSNEIMKLINEYKKQSLYIPENQLDKLLEILVKKIDKSYFNLIENISLKNELEKFDFLVEKKFYKNNHEIFYYEECQLINEEIIKLIIPQNKIVENLKINCAFGEKTAFLSFGKIINLGKLDNNFVFNTEIIIKLENDKSIDSIFNQIKQFNLNLFKENLKYSQMNLNAQKLFDYEIFILSKENEAAIREAELGLTKVMIEKQIMKKEQIRINSKKINSVNESLKNLILFYIDYIELERKSKNSLKDNYINNHFGYYYLLNFQWFQKYLEVFDLGHVFSYLMKNNIIEFIINYDELSLEEKINNILEIIKQFDQNLFTNEIGNINTNVLKDNNLFNLKFNYFQPNSDISFKYYSDFVLIKEQTYESLTKFLGLQYNIKNYCYFGDTLIFIFLNNDKKYTLQFGHFSKSKYYFSTNMFLDFNSQRALEKGLNLLIQEGSSKFFNSHLIIKEKNDYYSPIFDQNENLIGNAFIIDKNFSGHEFQNLFINNNLKTLILFYLENEILKKTIKTKNINKFRKYYLINANWLNQFKKLYEFDKLVKEVSKCPSIINMVKNFKGEEKISFSEKTLCSLIKSLPSDINVSYNKKQFEFINNISIEPNNEIYQFQKNNSLYYFNNFEIISGEIYNRIFGNSHYNDIDLNQQKNNYVNCIFYENWVMMELSFYASRIKDYVIEAGFFDSNNLFVPRYILIYKEQKKFLEHLNDLNKELGLLKFFNLLVFDKECYLSLYLSNVEIGKIYDLKIKFKEINLAQNKNNNQVQNQNMNINNNQFNNINNNFNNFKSNQIINNPNIINFNNNNQNFGNFPQMVPHNSDLQINNFKNKNQINLNNKPKTTTSSIKEDFPFPPLIGLKNVGATCYMNATLQCFSQIKELVDYFKYKPYIEQVIKKYNDKNKLCLAESFKELIENLWPSNPFYIRPEYVNQNSNNKYFAPYIFKEKISAMNELFKGAQANDSKDLVNFIVMTLHEEMNRSQNSLVNKNINFQNNMIDQTNKQLVFQKFLKVFQEENKSKISDLFYAQSNNSTICGKCGTIKYSFQTYFFLIFPLEEVRKFNIEFKKKQFIQSYNFMQNMNFPLFQEMLNNFVANLQNQNYVDIYTCFEYNQKVEYFTGDNCMYCNICNAQCPASYITKLFIGPQILIIILNRGIGIQFKVRLEFYQTLDLSNYIEKTNTGCKYNLIGVVTHMGESGASGHFIAYCRSPIDNNWYRYNDDLVSPVYNFKQEIMDYAMPYILFFQKIKE